MDGGGAWTAIEDRPPADPPGPTGPIAAAGGPPGAEPGARVEARRGAGVGAALGGGAVAGGFDGPVAARRLRPRTPTALIDDAVSVVRLHLGVVVAISAAFVLPLQLVASWVAVGPMAGARLVSELRDPSATAPLNVLAALVALPLVSAAVTELLGGARTGHTIGAAAAVRAALGRIWPLLAAWVLGLVVVAVSVPSIVGPVLLLPWVVLAAPISAAEGAGPLAALRRSWRLLRGRWWPAVGALVLLAATAYVLSSGVVLVAVSLGGLSGSGRGLWVAATATAAAVAALATTVVAAGASLLYLDLRVRREGLDLQLEADEVLPG